VVDSPMNIRSDEEQQKIISNYETMISAGSSQPERLLTERDQGYL